MDPEAKISIVIAAVSLFISIINILITIKESSIKGAPILEINQSYYNGNKYSFAEIEAQKNQEDFFNGEQIMLDQRFFQFNDASGKNNIKPYFSLILNGTNLEMANKKDKIRADENKELVSSVGFDKLVIRNVGSPLSKITVKEICFLDDEYKEILKLYGKTRNILMLNLRKNDKIEVLTSFVSDYKMPFNIEALNDEERKYAQQLSKIKGANLLNMRCISKADKWKKIKATVFTENLYEKKYRQYVEFYIEDNTYRMRCTYPKPVNRIKLLNKTI